MMSNRLSLLKGITLQFLVLSLFVRISLIFISLFGGVEFGFIALIKDLFLGLFFDIGVISFFLVPYILFLLIISKKFIGKRVDKSFSYFYFFITTLIILFSFFAEFTFWEEFQNRFNFIAVDYLIYTYEVIENINQSYPLPMLLSIIFGLMFLSYFLFYKLGIFRWTFSFHLESRAKIFLSILLLIPIFYALFISNTNAEWSENKYDNELSKAGVYSFFAAFRNNELSYKDFYLCNDIDTSFSMVRQKLNCQDSNSQSHSIYRHVETDRGVEEYKPNVIFICVESLSASFLGHYGNNQHITPHLDSLINESVVFENLYATGTRTVRGMEAITLSVPPTPGRSIVKRKNNVNLHNVGDVFESKGYSRTFYYGGDGYFDNMNQFFGGNGYNIVDRGRGFLFGDSFKAKRINIDDNEVTFENAWGVCDEDIYNKVIQQADLKFEEGKPFFNFIMTTSNHRPYTYPTDKINIASGKSREGAVKYTDFAINQFIEKSKLKPWFENTIFVIMADHCASSAGRWELNVSKYHIPAFIYNMKETPSQKINKQCSQVDLFPTLFGYFNWSYDSYFYGMDVNRPDFEERSFIGNYRKLGLLKGNKLTVLGEKKSGNCYKISENNIDLVLLNKDQKMLNEAVSYYQSIDYLYQNRLLEKTKN